MNPREINAFLAVAEHLHFGRAAESLHISPSALSRVIRQLEESVGAPLFERTTRSVSLTQAGTRLVGPAQSAAAALARLGGTIASLSGTVRLGQLNVPIFDPQPLLDAAPAPPVDIVVAPANDLITGLLAGELDIALTRLEQTPPRGLRAMLLRLDPVLALVHGSSTATAVDPRALRTWTFDVSSFWPDFERFQCAFEGAVGAALHRLPLATDDLDRVVDINEQLARHPDEAMLTIAGNRVLPAGYRTVGLMPLQPFLPWSLVWRADDESDGLAAFIAAARDLSARNDRARPAGFSGRPWVPPNDPWESAVAALALERS